MYIGLVGDVRLWDEDNNYLGVGMWGGGWYRTYIYRGIEGGVDIFGKEKEAIVWRERCCLSSCMSLWFPLSPPFFPWVLVLCKSYLPPRGIFGGSLPQEQNVNGMGNLSQKTTPNIPLVKKWSSDIHVPPLYIYLSTLSLLPLISLPHSLLWSVLTRYPLSTNYYCMFISLFWKFKLK